MMGEQLMASGNNPWSPTDSDENNDKGKAIATMGAQQQTFSPVGLKVLVVDDNRVCLAVLEKMLRQCNYSVTACSSAATALSLVQGKVIKFDLVLCDVHMPGMDGFKLLEALSLGRDLPVIMMSSDDETDVVMKGITRGACDYFLKPVCLQRLQTIWQHVFRRRELGDGGSGRDGDFLDGDPARAKFRNDPSRKRKGKEEAMEDLADSVNVSKKKTRLVWTTALHKQFVDAVKNLGTANAVPKQILEKMNVKGISRENVASHLQKYRKYLTDQEVASSEEDMVVNGLMSRQAFPIALEPYHMAGNYSSNAIDEISPNVISTPSPYVLSSLQPSAQSYSIPQSFVSPQPFGASQNTPQPQGISAPQNIPGPKSLGAPSGLAAPQSIVPPQNFAAPQNFVSPPSIAGPQSLGAAPQSIAGPQSLGATQGMAGPHNLSAPRGFPPHHDFRHSYTAPRAFSPPRNFNSNPGYCPSTDLYPIPSQSFQPVQESRMKFDPAEAMEMSSSVDVASSSNFIHRLRQFPGLVDVVRPSLVSPAYYNNLDYHN